MGILVTFSPELAKVLDVTGEISAGTAIMACYAGLSLGDLASGILSQKLQSRKKAIAVFLGLNVILVGLYPFIRGVSPLTYYIECSVLGFSIGFWAVFMMISTELFGTNLRATASTTAPNFVRGAVVPMTLAMQWLASSYGLLSAVMIIGAMTLGLALISLFTIEETFGVDLNFIESDGSVIEDNV